MKNENALYQIVCEDCNRPILNVDEDTIKSFKNLQSLYDELRNEREEAVEEVSRNKSQLDRAVELLRFQYEMDYKDNPIGKLMQHGADVKNFLNEIDGEKK